MFSEEMKEGTRQVPLDLEKKSVDQIDSSLMINCDSSMIL
jgi:hypothetical protein